MFVLMSAIIINIKRMSINPVKQTKCWLNFDFISIYKLNIQ